jgi:hypothetical protein
MVARRRTSPWLRTLDRVGREHPQWPSISPTASRARVVGARIRSHRSARRRSGSASSSGRPGLGSPAATSKRCASFEPESGTCWRRPLMGQRPTPARSGGSTRCSAGARPGPDSPGPVAIGGLRHATRTFQPGRASRTPSPRPPRNCSRGPSRFHCAGAKDPAASTFCWRARPSSDGALRPGAGTARGSNDTTSNFGRDGAEPGPPGAPAPVRCPLGRREGRSLAGESRPAAREPVSDRPKA